MGKNKQAQRTKNNARPSNSSRSAELLGTATPNFVGFSAVKDGGYVPVLPGLALCSANEIEMSNVDSNFQIVLKKMNKKDATTKYKALIEFAVLCKESELSTVEGMLPFWPRLYAVLAIDTEHRVREAAQMAQAALVKRVGKSIAMYLKQLAGPWFTSQYDTYAPAASAATNSFNDTFPQKKSVDAIVHCQREILLHICDNITAHTAQSLATQKSIGTDKMDTKLEKVLVSNLQAYSVYFKKVPAQEVEKTMEIHQRIVNSAKFWKLATHEALPVKTSFFNVLTSILTNAEKVLQDQKKKAVTALMNNLDEPEPALLLAVWETVLVAINKIEDWYLVVNIEKLVLPKLWRILRSGGQCCASIIYPNLLPFISQFPKFNIDTNTLFTNFFDNMRQGFSVKSVQMSRTETSAVIMSFVECLRYSIVLNNNDPEICSKLLKEQLIPVLDTCMTQPMMKQTLFSEVTNLVRYWSKNRYKDEDKLYTHLLQQFWIELRTLFNKQISTVQSNHSSLSQMYDSQIEFLVALKNVPHRKNLKVKFSDSNDTVKIEYPIKTVAVDNDNKLISELQHFVNELCVVYCDATNTNLSNEHIKYLNKLICHFESRELFVVLAKAFNKDADFLGFYDSTLKSWLLENAKESVYVVELIFTLLKYMNDTDKNAVLKSLTEVNDISIIRNVIQCGLFAQNRNDRTIMKWCSQARVSNLLINAAKHLVLGNDNEQDQNQNLILLAFEADKDGNSLIGEEGVNEIAMILSNAVNQDQESLKRFAKLLSSIVPLTWCHAKLTPGALQLLELLFKLCTQDHCISDDSFSTEDARNVWKKGISESIRKLPHQQLVDLTTKFAGIMWQNMYNSHEISLTGTLDDIASDFLEIMVENTIMSADNVEEIVLTFLTESNIKSWMAQLTELVLYGEVVTGNLYVSNPRQQIRICQDIVTIDLCNETPVDNTENCLIWALFNTNLLNNLFSRMKGNRNTDDEEELSTEECETSDLSFPGFINILASVVHTAALGHIYSNHYKSTKHYNNVNTILVSLKNGLRSLQKYITKDIYDGVLQHFKLNYSKYGSMLPYVIELLCTEIFPRENAAEYFENCRNGHSASTSDDIKENLYLQEIQTLYRYKTLSNTNLLASNDLSPLSTLTHQDDSAMFTNVLNKLISEQKDESTLFLHDCDVSNVTWDDMVLPLELIRLLTQLVQRAPGKLTSEHWDFVLISLTLWQLSINKSKQNSDDIKVTALIIAVSQLYHALQSLINKQELSPTEDLPATLLDEWKNVFVSDIQIAILQTWMFYAESCNRKSAVLKSVIALDYLGKAVSVLNGNVLFNNSPEKAATMTVDTNKVIKSCLHLLQSPVLSIQLGAYHALKHAVLELVQPDKAVVESENFDPSMLNIRKLEEVLGNTQNIVNTILMDFKLCDTVSCTIQPFTDSYTYTLAYLLAWAIILDMCAHAHGDLRYQYAEILKNDYFPSLLNNIFKLMPVEVLQDSKSKAVKLLEIFSTAPSLNFGESWTEWRLDHIVCWLYTNSLRHLPVLVRQWWSTADSRVSAAVDKITTHYVSPMLCQEELLDPKLVSVENMQVKVHPTAREVVALYQMDDTKLELNIVLPTNHPLGPVTVEPGQHAGGTANWRNCHMQLSIFLTHQNGSVWHGLMMWKKNLDKKFAGVEECYICFSIFHISTYQIPKLSCHTCKKKFHTPCLYKWFNTSQKSTCPICRNVF